MAAGAHTSVRVLVLCQDRSLHQSVCEALKPPAYEVRHIPANEVRVPPEDWQAELAVVDLEAGSWKDLLRRYGDRLPTIAVTRSADLGLRLRAFEDGADDVVVTRFCPEELVARVSALHSRTCGRTARPAPVLAVGALEIDLLHRRVRAGDREVHLSALEQSLLYFLAANAGRTLSRHVILDNLWGPDSPVESNVVDRHVHLLRRKLRALKQGELIETLPGRGYRSKLLNR